MSSGNARLVYSTEKTVQRKETPAEKGLPADLRNSQQKVLVRLDRKGRGGKSVTVIEGLQLPQKEKEVLLKRLKTDIGTGGTIKESALELQGDHCGTIISVMEKMGYRPKRSGG
ncbi:MAG: translation initiation factor [Nitrospirae bacterium]|nr:translation initiation factor [Nitrospirota bacterium]